MCAAQICLDHLGTSLFFFSPTLNTFSNIHAQYGIAVLMQAQFTFHFIHRRLEKNYIVLFFQFSDKLTCFLTAQISRIYAHFCIFFTENMPKRRREFCNELETKFLCLIHSWQKCSSSRMYCNQTFHVCDTQKKLFYGRKCQQCQHKKTTLLRMYTGLE